MNKITIQAIVFYPMPLVSQLDERLTQLAEQCGGELVGSGSDGEARDLVFEFKFPMSHLVFTEGCLNHDDSCEVLLRVLSPDQAQGAG